MARQKMRDSIAAAIRAVLKEKHMTPSALATQMGKSRNWISTFLKAGATKGMTLATIDDVCAHLGLEPVLTFKPAVTSPVLSSSDNQSAGSHGAPRVEARLQQLESENAQLREHVKDLAKELTTLGAALARFPETRRAIRSTQKPAGKRRKAN